MNGSPTVLGVLIIDDNPEWSRLVRMRIERSLPESNRVVRWESTLAGGIKALNEFHADSILLDLTLTDSPDPHETLRSIPKLLADRHSGDPYYPPTIVMSSHVQKDNPWTDQLVMDCMMAGAYNVFPKDEMSVAAVVRDIVFTHVRNTVRAASRRPQ